MSSRKLTGCTLLTRDNGFSEAAVCCYGGRNLQLGRWRCFLTCHRVGGAGGKYRSVSRALGLLIGNRWMSGLVVLEIANCSVHATVEGALSETVATVSLSTVP